MALDKNKLKGLLFGNTTPKTSIEPPEDEEEQKKKRQEYYTQLQEYLFTPGPMTEGRQRGEQAGAFIDNVSDRKLLTDYYKAYSKNQQEAAERGDSASYYKYEYITNKIADKLGTSKNILTYGEDLLEEGKTNVLGNIAGKMEAGVGAYNALEENIEAGTLYNIASRAPGSKMSLAEKADYDLLKKFEQEFPENETIKKLVGWVESGNFKGDKGTIDYMVRDINNYKGAERTQNFINKYTADERQNIQDLKLREQLTDYGFFPQLGLDAAGTVSNMATDIGLSYGLSAGLGITDPLVTGKITTAGMSISKAGEQLADSLEKGYDFDKAIQFAAASGINEFVWESLGGDFVNAALAGGISRTPVGTAVQKFLNKTGMQNKVAKAAIQYLAGINEEGFEEIFTGITDATLRSLILNDDSDWEGIGKELAWSYIESILPTVILGGFGRVQVNKQIKAQEEIILKSIDNAPNLSEEEKTLLKQGVSDASKDARMGLTEDWDNMMKKLHQEIDRAKFKQIGQGLQEAATEQPTVQQQITSIRPGSDFAGTEYDWLKQYYPEETSGKVTRIKIQEPIEAIDSGEIYGTFGEGKPSDARLNKAPVMLSIPSILDGQEYAPGLEPGYYIYKNLGDALKDMVTLYGQPEETNGDVWYHILDATDGEASITSLLGEGQYEYDPRPNVGGAWISIGKQAPVEQPTVEPATQPAAEPTQTIEEPVQSIEEPTSTVTTTTPPQPAEELPSIEPPTTEQPTEAPETPQEAPTENPQEAPKEEPEKPKEEPKEKPKVSTIKELNKVANYGKYGDVETEKVKGRDIEIIKVDKNGPHFPYKEYFRFDNPFNENDGSQDATMTVEQLNNNPIVALFRKGFGGEIAIIFDNYQDMMDYMDQAMDLELIIARNATPGSSYVLEEETSGFASEYVWRSDYSGRRVDAKDYLSKYVGEVHSAFKNPTEPVRYIDLEGETFTDAASFANIMQKAIDPSGETDRIVFTKFENGKYTILGTNTTSLNRADETNRSNYRFVSELADFYIAEAQELGADYVFQVHNHLGHSNPSGRGADLGGVTLMNKIMKYAKAKTGSDIKYGGGLVVGFNGYSFYGGGGRKGFKNTTETATDYWGRKNSEYVEKPYENGYKYDGFIDAPWTKETIRRHNYVETLEKLSKENNYQPGYSTVILADLDGEPFAIINAKDEILKGDSTKINNFLYELSRNYYGGEAFIVTRNPDVYDDVRSKNVRTIGNIYIRGKGDIDYSSYNTADSKILGYYSPDKRTVWYTPKAKQVRNEEFIGRDVATSEPNKEPAHRLEKPKGKDVPKRGKKTTLTDFYKKNSYMAQQASKIDRGEIQKEERKASAKLIDFYRYIRQINKGRIGKLTGANALNAYGTHNSQSHWIRMRQATNASSAIHEYGHEINASALNMEALDKLFTQNPKLKDEFIRACTERYGKIYANQPKRQIQEGFAEAVRRFVEEADMFAQDFPNISTLFANEAQTNKAFAEAMVHLEVMREMAKDWISQDPQSRLHSNIDMLDDGVKDVNVDSLFSRWATKLAEGLFNDLAYLQKLDRAFAKKTGVKYNKLLSKQKIEDTYRLAGNAEMIMTELSRGYYDENGKKITTGLREIMEEFLFGIKGDKNIQKRINDLVDYGVAMRELELYQTRDDVILNDKIETIQAVINKFKNDKKLNKALRQISENSHALLNLAVEKDLLTREAADEIIANNLLYMPLNRVAEGKVQSSLVKQKGGSTGKTYFRLRGSDAQIENPLISLLGNWGRILYNIQTNDTNLKLAHMANEADMGEWFEAGIDPKNTYRGQVKMEAFESKIREGLKKFEKAAGVNLPVEAMMSKMDMDAVYRLFVPEVYSPEDMMITYFENGKRKAIQFADNDLGRGLYQAITKMNVEKSNKVLDFFNAINYPLKMGATAWNVEFALSNMQSDSFNRFLYSEGLAFYVPYITSIFHVGKLVNARTSYEKGAKNSAGQMYEKFKRSGASQEGTFRGENAYLRDSVKEVYGFAEDKLFGKAKIKDGASLKNSLKKKFGKVGDVLNTIPELSEEATRFTEFCLVYNQMKAKGVDEETAIREAGIKARQITQDFTVQGKWMRTLNKIVPFASARIGGLYRFEQELRNHPTRLLTKMAMLAALTAAIEAFGDDDDKDYKEELNKQKRFDNYVLPNPFGDKQHPWIIKKPQGTAKYFLNFVEMAIDVAEGRVAEEDAEKVVWDWLGMSVKDQMPVVDATDLMPNVLQGVVENAMNKDFYYGTPIVSKDLEKLDPRHQYDEYTSEVAKAIGNAFNWSPLKIDNIMESWFAGVGQRTLDISSYAIRKARGDENENPSWDTSEYPGFTKIFANAFRSSESINRIYDRLEELETEEAEGRLTDELQAEYSEMQEAKSALAQINKKMKAVRADSSLSADQKQTQLDDLKELRIDTARHYLGKDLLDDSNASKITTLSFYPANTIYTYNTGSKKVEVVFDEKLQEEYAKRFEKEYEKQLKALQRTSEYKNASASEKLELEKNKKSSVRQSINNDMKEVAYKQQYKSQ